MSLREDGYFEQVSAQLESTVGAQFSDVTGSASENAESGVSLSVNGCRYKSSDCHRRSS